MLKYNDWTKKKATWWLRRHGDKWEVLECSGQSLREVEIELKLRLFLPTSFKSHIHHSIFLLIPTLSFFTSASSFLSFSISSYTIQFLFTSLSSSFPWLVVVCYLHCRSGLLPVLPSLSLWWVLWWQWLSGGKFFTYLGKTDPYILYGLRICVSYRYPISLVFLSLSLKLFSF